MPSEDIRWPVGGEIDILENRGRISNISSSALHFGKQWNKKSTLVGEALIPRQVPSRINFIYIFGMEGKCYYFLS